MKTWKLSFLLLSFFFAVGCEQAGIQNNAATPVAGYAQNGAATQTPDDNRNQAAANTTPAAETEEQGLTADFEGTAGITENKNEGKGAALLTAVRTAQQQNFDRVVFEFAGAALPGYHIEYIDKPVRQCGSGNVVPLKGDGWLQVRFQPANAHTEAGKPTVKDREMLPNHR